MSFDPYEIVNIAIDAGQAIMEVYNSPGNIEVETKNDDSPLTKADLAAHDVIIQCLASVDPDVPIASAAAAYTHLTLPTLLPASAPLAASYSQDYIRRTSSIPLLRISMYYVAT